MTVVHNSGSGGIRKILIANRGACGCRIVRTCKKLGIETVAIYPLEDRHSLHVKQATEKYQVSSYLAQDEIIKVAQRAKAEGVHPGYGFLAENAAFARAVEAAGLKWIGPDPAVMDVFASKTTARAKAIKCNVPVLSGSPALADSNDAKTWADKIGYPVLLKPAGGGGGIGMKVCENGDELAEYFKQSAALASRLFADSSVFIERFIRNARHIEVQVFGDGKGEVVHLGERECSVQRRFQKIVEEAPSTALTDEVRGRMFEAALRLCQSVNYNSAGTVEFVYDDDTQEFYFLEVNTRIQVEHGITEMINPGVDLVQWMVYQAHPATSLNLSSFVWKPTGHAIELRVCAEDPTKDFQPASGVIGEFSLPSGLKGARFETWVFRGCEITPAFDSLILKVLQWAPSRSESIRRLQQTLSQVVVKGPPNNIPMLSAFLQTAMFATGKTYTNTLSRFKFAPRCIEVLDAGLSVTIQDYPGRTRRGLWRVGIPPSGPMDHLSARLANSLVGNIEDMSVLEVTVKGPSLKFHFDALCAVSGAAFNIKVNGLETPQYTSFPVKAGDVLELGHLASECGTRAYIAVGGGFDVPKYLGSRSTFIKGGFGGYQGRALMVGDVIAIGVNNKSTPVSEEMRSLPSSLWPKMVKDWVVGVLPGPMANPDFMRDEDIQMLHRTKWSVHHNSNRLGIRLIGPSPKWARTDGGEGGSHPSNIHDCEYAIGTINFTGDMPIIIAHDGPSLGGFVCPLTIVKSHLWKIGQFKAGDTVRFELLSLQDAISSRLEQNSIVRNLRAPTSADITIFNPSPSLETKAVLLDRKASGSHPGVQIRLAGDSNVLVEYGPMVLDIRLRIRIHVLEEKLLSEDLIGLEETAPGVRSLQIRYDPEVLPLMDLCELISLMDDSIEDLSSLQIKSRIFHLPLAWNHSGVNGALEQYMKSIRPEAPYLPSNIEFVAKNNGVTVEDVVEKVYRASYMCLGLGDVYLGACCAVPTDPRDRLVVPKFNPARTFTQEGTVGLGGAYMCIYPMDSPGGYQLVGRTLPIWNTWGRNAPELFSPERPWMLEMFDQIRFYKVEECELEDMRQAFRDGSFMPKIEHSIFDAGEYDTFLQSIQAEVLEYQQLQRNSSEIQNQLEKESLARLDLAEDVSTPAVGNNEMNLDSLSNDFEVIRAPVSSKVWSIKVKEGDTVSMNEIVLVLEAMKMEFSIKAGNSAASYTVHKLLVQNGQVVNLGLPLVVLEKVDK